MNPLRTFPIFLILFLVLFAPASAQKARTVITTDGEIDDVDSFIRMLLFANEFKIEGLIYSSSQWHYKGDGKGTPFTSEMEMTRRIYGEQTSLRWPGTTWMQELLAEYAKVHPNLLLHDPGFPAASDLLKLIRVGNIDFEGEMEKDTPGSDFIKELLLDKNDTPIYLQVWGGTNTIARALKSIEDQYSGKKKWPEIYSRVSKKAIIYTILDQDATYRKYISKSWPDIPVYYNENQFWSFAYFWKRQVPDALQYYLKGAFMRPHILENHGPLTPKYYSYGDGQKQPGDPEHIHGDASGITEGQWGSFEPYDFISEGDSPAYFHLIDVGLGNLQNPEYGGWGGRLTPSDSIPNRWDDGQDVVDFNPYTQKYDAAYPQTRWMEPLQLEFAARADWCVNPYEAANHPPKVWLNHSNSLAVNPGQWVQLEALAEDPDGDALSYSWWQYQEADTYPNPVTLHTPYLANANLKIPSDIEKGQNIHLIVAVTDGQFPNLTRYQRVILTY